MGGGPGARPPPSPLPPSRFAPRCTGLRQQEVIKYTEVSEVLRETFHLKKEDGAIEMAQPPPSKRAPPGHAAREAAAAALARAIGAARGVARGAPGLAPT